MDLIYPEATYNDNYENECLNCGLECEKDFCSKECFKEWMQ